MSHSLIRRVKVVGLKKKHIALVILILETLAGLNNQNVFEEVGPKADGTTSDRTAVKVVTKLSRHFL